MQEPILHSCLTVTRGPILHALLLFLTSLFTYIASSYAQDDARPLCARYHFKSAVTPPLTSAEKTLICGNAPSSAGALKGSPAWSIIPSSQAILQITAFLQARGYLKPKIESHGKNFEIDPGPLAKVKSVEFEGAPDHPDLSPITRQTGKILTPELLTELERKTSEELTSHGFPCPDVHAEANADHESIVIHVRSGTERRFGTVTSMPVPNTVDGILSRYYAFESGELYDDQLLAISADRAISAGIVEDTYFIPVCRDTSEINLKQQIRAGAPRILTLGFSVNTEEIGRLSLSLRNTRVGKSASDAELEVSASSKIQELTAFYQDYFLPTPSRQWIRPLIRVLHENENPFEVVQETGEVQYGTSIDFARMNSIFSIGPEFTQFQTLQGAGPNEAHALFLETEARLISHDYEFNHNAARGGSQLIARSELSSASVGSQFSARRLEITGEKFWRWGSEEKPSPFIVKTRGGWRTTGFSGDSPSILPPELRDFLGGQADLRGFGRLELPGNSIGGLSAWFGNFELRPDFWGTQLEPILFVDAGEFGGKSFSIDRPLYWSPGIGLNYASPIGTFQASLAHGIVSGGDPANLSHWQFYLSLGGAI